MIKSFLEKFQILAKHHPNEIPSLSQIYQNGILLAERFNQVEETSTTHLHSEILCIEAVQKK